ncbi:SGNH/GDSL hydrolase family protein [Ferruginibacter albus]|uniref:hypothetical protein n=1 Tax=Ferruginibacter albus TaxID=2875540 RepID=UPI001CC77458|nr:hypothetical protein [Ferruginibacter albus]UAY52424.1 hypothetical protein K9M53_01730 [Ferruginibacter albus]
MNVKKKVLLFNIFFLLLLLAATFLFEWKPTLAGESMRRVSILADIQKDSLRDKIAISNTTDCTTVAKQNISIKNYATYNGLINSSGKEFALQDFLQKLLELKQKKRKKIRIAYFGDSMIEGDLITADIREQLQNIFGGGGVGFVPVTSIVAGFRQTVIHSFSSDWKDVNFKSDDKAGSDLFISGHSFFAGENSWVSYKTVNRPHLNSFNTVSVLYGKPAEGESNSATLTINGNAQAITATGLFNSFETKVNEGKELKLGFSSPDIPLYGAAMEADSGIVVDNFSFRGISGVEFKYFSEEFLKQVQQERPYDLLVFQYGPNLLFKPNLTDFSWYQKMMLPVLKKIHGSIPDADMLIISTADKSFKYDDGWHTAKGVQPLIDVQYGMAKNCGADFFNLYNAMGGEDKMVSWVQGDTVYANKDYTHVNFKGAHRFGNYIFNAIMKEYDDFEKHPTK